MQHPDNAKTKDEQVASLIRKLKDQDKDVRRRAAEALGKIGDARAVDPLLQALKDQDWSVRDVAAEALGKIGAPAVDPLLQALKDQDWSVRWRAAVALGKIGDDKTLPRKVLAETRLTPEQRLKALESLQKVRYREGSYTLQYSLPDISTFCQQMLQGEDAAVREGARAVLLYALQGRTLLRPSQRDEAAEKEILLRPAEGVQGPVSPETLLRASEAPEGPPTREREKRGILARFRQQG